MLIMINKSIRDFAGGIWYEHVSLIFIIPFISLPSQIYEYTIIMIMKLGNGCLGIIAVITVGHDVPLAECEIIIQIHYVLCCGIKFKSWGSHLSESLLNKPRNGHHSSLSFALYI